MELDREIIELLEELRKRLDLVEAYWYFVEHGADAYECGLAVKTLAKFNRTAAPKVIRTIYKLHEKLEHFDG